MSREEAIDIIKCLAWHTRPNEEDIEQAIKVLSQEPSRDMEEIEEVINCDADAETKCKMISNIVYSKPHYFKALSQEPAYCDRNICLKNEYNGIGCDECEVTKSQEPKTGHWIPLYDYTDERDDHRCSICGFESMGATRYCPDCGTRMYEL